MSIFPFLRKKINEDESRRPDRLTPEEERDLEGPVPDMRDLDLSADERIDTPEGEVEVRGEIDVPEKGVLRTDNLVKKYGKRTVANHVSIELTQGEIVGLLGPNGAGKTTTVENNIRAILEMTNTSKEYQKAKLEQLISEFNLGHVRHNIGTGLSGGERRRTEIARCLAINPKFIMLDEPFAAVDPIAVEDIQEVVYHLKERNIGVLITDHKADSILGITDRAYMLFEGRVLFQGTSEELASNPVVREKYLGRDFIFTPKKFEPRKTNNPENP